MKEKEHFLDKNTLIAVALVFLSWLAWDAHMRKKYPVTEKNEQIIKTKEIITHSKSPLPKSPSEEEKNNILEQKSLPQKEQNFPFESKNLSFEISSKGMGLKSIVLNQILDRKGKAIVLFSKGDLLPFETVIDPANNSLNFHIKKLTEFSWEGVYKSNNLTIIKTLNIDPKKFLINTKLHLKGDLSTFSHIDTLFIQTTKPKKKSFFLFFTPPDILSFFVSSAQGTKRIPLDTEELPLEQNLTAVKTVGLGTKYFGQAWIKEESSDLLPKFQVIPIKNTEETKNYMGILKYPILNPYQKELSISYNVFIGPKDLQILEKHFPDLINWVDFWFFGSLARFILEILQFFFSITGNWGVAVILLTLIVRLLLLPFVISSHKSMEIMKKVQPEIQKIKTKFKKDSQRINQEVMALMKANKANPLGGCLPLLLQIPVFWALWQALSNSYSLYQAPFILWIKDLSWKDPFYILPVLMGVTMFLQQKVTPVTMNKEMMRAMQIMPIFMTIFMINLPSGLVLYMLISTLFGIIQQIYLNKKSTKETSKK